MGDDLFGGQVLGGQENVDCFSDLASLAVGPGEIHVEAGLAFEGERCGVDLFCDVQGPDLGERKWPTWAPRTRDTDIYALARFLPLVADPKAPEPPKNMRAYLRETFVPQVNIDLHDPCERWLNNWVLTLGELTRDNLATADQRFAIGARGRALAPRTLNRHRVTARAFIRRAVELQKIPTDPWPPRPKGSNRRKANQVHEVIDVRKLPAIRSVMALLSALDEEGVARSPAHRVMTEVAFYAGLRPSEVLMLRPRGVSRPKSTWGRIWVDEADDGYGHAAVPKTGRRYVPIPPQLVTTLNTWIAQNHQESDDLLFTSDLDRWRESLKRGCRHVAMADCTPYTFRHIAATLWIRAGVPLAEVARRLGHSVEMLVSTYIGAMDGDEEDGNDLIARALASESNGAGHQGGETPGERGGYGTSTGPGARLRPENGTDQGIQVDT